MRARRRRSRLVRRTRRLAVRRVVLAVALVVLILVPLPVLASDTPPRQAGCAGSGCHAQAVHARLWAARLAGTWSAGTGPGTVGDGGTVPVNGQGAYLAVGSGLVTVGTGLTLTGYDEDNGSRRWQTTLAAPAGTEIMSVRAWPGAITVGLLAPDGRSRSEAVLDPATGTELRSYPAAVFGGAVSASTATTVVIGTNTVTSYNNATGRIRWQHTTGGDESWQADGQTLYLAQAPGGPPGSSPVTALNVINMETGAERVLSSPLGQPFSGTLAMATDGAALFASSAGVQAYDGETGRELWDQAGWIPEGADPAGREADFATTDGALVAADPRTGHVRATAPAAAATGTAAFYVVRDGVAFGLNSGANGDAWGYDMATRKVTWTWPALPWPHFFSDPSGLGGSAAASGDIVAVSTCPTLASPGICADPELVAFKI